MNIQSVVDNNFFSVFQGMPTVEREAQIKAVGYIMQLAAQTHTDISQWDLFEVFGQGNGRIYVAKTAINERFFAKRETQVTPQKALPRAVVEAGIATLEAQFKRRREEAQIKAKDELRYHIREARGYFKSGESELKQAATKRAIVVSMEPFSSTVLITEMEKIVAAGFFEIPEAQEGLNRGLLVLHTRSDVYQQLVNPAAGVDLRVNFGRMLVEIDLLAARTRVKPLDKLKKLDVLGRYHPHVDDDDGQVCWGNAADMVSSHLPMLKLSGCMEALATILTTYNEESPYVALHEFDEAVTRGCAKKACNDCETEYWEDDGAECDCGASNDDEEDEYGPVFCSEGVVSATYNETTGYWRARYSGQEYVWPNRPSETNLDEFRNSLDRRRREQPEPVSREDTEAVLRAYQATLPRAASPHIVDWSIQDASLPELPPARDVAF